MDRSLCKLTLVYPASAADSLIELILAMKPGIGGFTTFKASGHGFDFSKATLGERVKGCVERGVLMAVMPRARVARLVETIGEKLPIPHMIYWLEPVLEVGRLVEGHAGSADAEGAVLSS